MAIVVDSAVQTEDVIPVGSRVTWSAIVAGSVLALALQFLLSILGAAAGLSLSDKVSPNALGTGAIVFAIIVTSVCLFVGGLVASRMTVGENPAEGALYGILVWAGVFGMLMVLMSSGVRMGYNALVGAATAGNVAAENTTANEWESAAHRAGVPQSTIDDWRQKALDATLQARQAAENPQKREEAANAVTRVAWFSFLGAWISMMAAAAGGYCGTGPVFRLWVEKTRPSSLHGIASKR